MAVCLLMVVESCLAPGLSLCLFCYSQYEKLSPSDSSVILVLVKTNLVEAKF